MKAFFSLLFLCLLPSAAFASDDDGDCGAKERLVIDEGLFRELSGLQDVVKSHSSQYVDEVVEVDFYVKGQGSRIP